MFPVGHIQLCFMFQVQYLAGRLGQSHLQFNRRRSDNYSIDHQNYRQSSVRRVKVRNNGALTLIFWLIVSEIKLKKMTAEERLKQVSRGWGEDREDSGGRSWHEITDFNLTAPQTWISYHLLEMVSNVFFVMPYLNLDLEKLKCYFQLFKSITCLSMYFFLHCDVNSSIIIVSVG